MSKQSYYNKIYKCYFDNWLDDYEIGLYLPNNAKIIKHKISINVDYMNIYVRKDNISFKFVSFNRNRFETFLFPKMPIL